MLMEDIQVGVRIRCNWVACQNDPPEMAVYDKTGTIRKVELDGHGPYTRFWITWDDEIHNGCVRGQGSWMDYAIFDFEDPVLAAQSETRKHLTLLEKEDQRKRLAHAMKYL